MEYRDTQSNVCLFIYQRRISEGNAMNDPNEQSEVKPSWIYLPHVPANRIDEFATAARLLTGDYTTPIQMVIVEPDDLDENEPPNS
jgi:hypothetical protein